MSTRKLFVLIVLLTISAFQINVHAGTPVGTFTVINRGSVTDAQPYETAVAAADLESFRYRNTRCIITFDNGLQVELLSAAEMQQLGHNIVVGDYKVADEPNWIQPVFHLNQDGTLSAMYTKPDLKQRTNTNQQ